MKGGFLLLLFYFLVWCIVEWAHFDAHGTPVADVEIRETFFVVHVGYPSVIVPNGIFINCLCWALPDAETT